jgi:hypothetical protein
MGKDIHILSCGSRNVPKVMVHLTMITNYLPSPLISNMAKASLRSATSSSVKSRSAMVLIVLLDSMGLGCSCSTGLSRLPLKDRELKISFLAHSDVGAGLLQGTRMMDVDSTQV